jgi:hypothetical protein
MADAMEIIISAVDSASEVFQSIIESATNMASGITDAVGSAGSDFDTIAENAANFSDSVSNIDTSTLEELASELGMDTEEVERLISSAADLGTMSAGFNEVAAAADELEQEIQDDIDKMDELGSAGDVMAAQTLMDFANGVSDSMSAMADKAGTVQDSWTRLGLAAEGAGINMDTMKSSVSSLADETGRAGGSIRESFITMTSAGITDMNTMQEVFRGASAQAFVLGTDVNSLADKFSGMAMKSTISEKTLKGTGVTMQELGEAMGMQGASIDEIKQKWSELDTNQRAAALGMAASMNEGQTANDAYKNSWQGLQDQVEIAKGKLMTMAGQVLLPVLVPAMKLASDILSGLGTVIEGVMKGPFGGLVSIVGASAGIFMIAFAGVLALKNILGFLKLEASLAKIEMMALAFAEEFQATGSITSAAANMIGASGFTGLATAAWGAATAVWAAIAPFLPFIAAAALVAIAIYEVGKAFGWWTDVSSMLDAIKAGLTEMWEAFINHPDVQAAIQAISDAFSWLTTVVGEVGQAILDFFGINESGSFDILHTLINGIGEAWNAVRPAIMFVIDVWMQLINTVNQFRLGQIDLPTFIMNILTILANAYRTIFTTIIGLVVRFASQMVQRGISAATRFVNGIITWLKSLPGRAYSALIAVVSRIVSAGQQWVNAAKNKASSIVSNVYNTLTGLPGKIASALSGVVSAFTKPFTDAYNKIKEKVDQIKEMASNIPIIGGAFGGDDYVPAGAMAGVDLSRNSNITTTTGVDHNLTGELTLIHDLRNLPPGVTADEVASLINETVTSEEFAKNLARNTSFQEYDLSVKQKLIAKNNRARGI